MDDLSSRQSTIGLAKVLIPTLVVLMILAALGKISGGLVLAVFVVVSAGVFWALPRGAASRLDSKPETVVDTTIAAAVLDALPDPVILLNAERRVIAANLASRQLLGDKIKGRDLTLLLRQPEALETVNAVLGGANQADAQFSIAVPISRELEIHSAALPMKNPDSARAIVVLHDVTITKSAEEMRADFVANVSHELRSPLSSLVGFIETLKGAAKDDADARERFLDIMDDEARRMARLIDDLLSLSKVESNEHIQPQGRVKLGELLGGVIDSITVRAREKSITFDLIIEPDLPDITGEGDELTEVFHNLIDNAVKYGAAGKPVIIKASRVDRIPEQGGPGVSVTVRDQGEGIATEHIPRLTERFYRADKGRSRQMGGTGLGLAIVKHIVNRHRGRITIESRLGQGSVFTVYLCVKKDQESLKSEQ